IGLAPLLAGQVSLSEASSTMMTREPVTGGAANQVYAAKAMADASNVQAPSPDLALAFFCGGVFVIFILLCYEAYLWKKRR
ncbi:MAG: ArsR family transcriptional regulator, partial [Methanoregula sp.]|nr:ArsR family transcriptional regulator [Methanoregula sp.]